MMAIKPPVLVPPIRSKYSHGFGVFSASVPVMDDHGSLDLFEAVDRDRPRERGIDLDRPPQGQGRSWVRSEAESIFKRAKKAVYRGSTLILARNQMKELVGI